MTLGVCWFLRSSMFHPRAKLEGNIYWPKEPTAAYVTRLCWWLFPLSHTDYLNHFAEINAWRRWFVAPSKESVLNSTQMTIALVYNTVQYNTVQYVQTGCKNKLTPDFRREIKNLVIWPVVEPGHWAWQAAVFTSTPRIFTIIIYLIPAIGTF